MEAFKKVTSQIVTFPRKDVDTDMIIPAQYLTSTSRDGYGEHLFAQLKKNDPEFVLNKPESVGRQILVTGENFGCGSSREHAVWALFDAGFRVVIAESFADIFRSNSAKNGLLLIELPKEEIERIVEEGDSTLTVDLETQVITFSDGRSVSFEYDAFRKKCLLDGLDDLDFIKGFEKEISDFRSQQDKFRFYKTTEVNN